MPNRAGQWPAPCTTARPAEKGTRTEGVDPALLRIAVNGAVALAAANGHVLRRKVARVAAIAHIKGEPTLRDLTSDELSPEQMAAYLRATFTSDPTGVAAVRNVTSGGASHG